MSPRPVPSTSNFPRQRRAASARCPYPIIDKTGTVRFKKVLDNPKEPVSNDELLGELDKLK
jgi:hypothetical protein